MSLSRLPSKIDGGSYVAQWQKLNDAAAEKNGVDPAPELQAPLSGGFVPRLSNLEVLAICQAWRRCAARTKSRAGKVGSLTGLYEIELAALGWENDGDKFKVWSNAPKWPTAFFAPTADDAWLLGHAWAQWLIVATELDDRGTVVKPLYLDLSRSGYDAGARAVYSRMLNEGPPGGTVEPSPIEETPAPTPQPELIPDKGWPFWFWLLVVYGGYRVLGGRRV